MTRPQEKLAQSLEVLNDLQENRHIVALKTSELSRVHRERLLQNGFIKKVLDGWYISSAPNELEGDSTSWYASFWNFCARYLKERFGKDYCLSADQSLKIHAGNQTVPHQLIVRTRAATNKPTPLPFNTSLFSMQSSLPDEAEIIEVNGLRILTLPSSLIYCSPDMFAEKPTDVRTAVTLIQDSSQILGLLLDGGHSKIAGRL